MHFSPLISFVTVAVAGVTYALDYKTYASTVSCSGDWFGCTTGGSVCCGPMPSGWGYSAQFDYLPMGTQGKGYSDGVCTASTAKFALYGDGTTKCWNGGGTRVRSLKWFYSSSRIAGRAADESATDAAGEEGAGECVLPDSFGYTDEKGAERVIKIPQEAGAADAVAKLHARKEWAALQRYEAHAEA